MKTPFSLFIIAFFLYFGEVHAQIFSPQLAGANGIFIIYYPYGYYQGYVINGVANGGGTFYWRDGTFFRESFSKCFYHGPGVIISPHYGYVAGCWSNGVFAGPCQNVPNPYTNVNTLQQTVAQVQQERPANDDYQAVSPEGYRITRIDPNTQMGQSLLGRSRP